jgi:adenine-specific DNA methylase
MPVPQKKSLLEVQFPIGQLSLESYLERDARTGKVLNSLGKWWGTKPIVLTRAVILGSLLQRRYCKRMEEIDGPPPESWAEINAYCGTRANSL